MTRFTEDSTLVEQIPNLPTDVIILMSGTDKSATTIVNPTQLDPFLSKPTIYGVVVSDIIDHIAAAYAQLTGADMVALSEAILATARREHKFKKDDPSRSQMRGTVKIEGDKKKTN